MSQTMETLSLDPRGLQNAVIAFAEVDWAGEVAMLVCNQGRILSEVSFPAEVQNGIHGGLVEGDVSFAGGGLELTHFDFPAAGSLGAVSAGDLLHAALEVDHFVGKVNIAVQEPQHLAGTEAGVQHEGISRCLLVDSLPVTPRSHGFGLEPLNFLWTEGGDSLKGGLILLALAGHEVGLFNHRCRKHGILVNQLLLSEVSEIICQDIVDLLNGGVGVTLIHPMVQHRLDVR